MNGFDGRGRPMLNSRTGPRRFRRLVTVLGAAWLFDESVVLDQIGIPLIGLATDEAVEPVKTLLQRPLRLSLPPLDTSSSGTLWSSPTQKVRST
jgi:hypothetical protein